jgi:hypothetical protein
MTRTYLDFNTTSDAIEGLLQIYEQHLKRQDPELKDALDYELSDLVAYLDQIADLSCMVYNET